jgi:hypothetical protein
MRTLLGFAVLATACGSKAPAAEPSVAAQTPTPAQTETETQVQAERADDPREVPLRTMTELLALLADRVAEITKTEKPSKARCKELTTVVTRWGEEHYEAYDEADGEGTYLGLTAADADDPVLRGLAIELARDSALLIESVDEDCLYGSGDYGDALYEYLISYQGLAHWVREGDSSVWDYEALIAGL